MLAVHSLQNAVRTRLNRQVEIRHELFDPAMSGNQIVAHVARMTCGVPKALDARNACETLDQLRETSSAAVRTRAAVSVHILAEKRDLAGTQSSQTAHLGFYLRHRPGIFRDPGIGHHAE